MQLRIKDKIVLEYSWKRMLYALAFFFVCVIDQRVKTTAFEGLAVRFPDLTGLVITFLIFSHYKWEDFKTYKLPYFLWTVISLSVGSGAIVWGMNNRDDASAWVALVIQLIFLGYVVIHTFIDVVLKKNCPKLNKCSGFVWLVMMLLMMLSRSEYVWPFVFFVAFGCLCLTDFTIEEQEDMFQGMMDGIILAFFVFQGLCYMFRPYDIVRYYGLYLNPNANALFYLEVLAAVFGKLLCAIKNKSHKWICVCCWLGAGAVFSHIFMTIGRTAWLVAFTMGLVFLWAVKRIQKKRNFIKNGIVLVLCVCLMFPISYGLIRYIPPLFHHPVWFAGEWGEDRVHSWEAWDSEKYIQLDELMETAVGRIWNVFASPAEGAPASLEDKADEGKQSEKMTHEEYVYMNQERNGMVLRKFIYSDYVGNLNWWGHTTAEKMEYKSIYIVEHAHNIYLQYGTDFGIIVMLGFIILVIRSCVILVKRFVTDGYVCDVVYLMFLLVTTGVGLLEYSYGVGSIGQTMMFFVFVKVIVGSKERLNNGAIAE